MRARIILSLAVVAIIVLLAVVEFHRLRALKPDVERSDAPDYDCVEDRTFPPRDAEIPGLVDITHDVGLDFVPAVGPLGTYFMPESTGAGAAFLDFDRDGRLDIYFVNCGRSPKAVSDFPEGTRTENRLFRQLENGRFADVTESSGLGDSGYGSGVAVGDIDNDGYPDVYITNYGPDRLYRNNRDGTFTDISAASGLENHSWATCAAMFDYDRDGWLDIVVVNYTEDPDYNHSISCGFQHGTVSYCGPHKFRQTIDRLYHNESSRNEVTQTVEVRFRDVTEESGFGDVSTYGFGVICADLTGDGWPDVFIANDGDANRCWVNQQNGTFREEALQRGLAVNHAGQAEAGMGVALGDVDGDLHQDILISHLTRETATLYKNTGTGHFVDLTDGSGIDRESMKHTGWGVALIDLNLDGLLDIPLVNGLVIPCHSGFPFHGEDRFQERVELIRDSATYWRAYADQNVLMMGLPGSRFQPDLNYGGDFSRAVASGRGLVYGDVDNDGDLDLLVTNCGTAARLYRNDLTRQGNWLTVGIVTADSGRDALGAEVTVQTDTRSFRQILAPHTSYLASHAPTLNFGLGESTRIIQIQIRWPDGPTEESIELFAGCEVNQFITLRRGEGGLSTEIRE